jgi:hypothetical protein
MQSYVDAWATVVTPENVITKDRPQEDRGWEAYIQWYTPRTHTRVMYIPPQPPVSFPDVVRILPTVTYPV